MKPQKQILTSLVYSFCIAILLLTALPVHGWANYPPSAPAVSIVRAGADNKNAQAGLEVIADGSYTAAGDPVTYKYVWYKNNVLQPDLTAAIVPKDKIKKDEIWRCEVTPYSAEMAGQTVTVQTTVVNSAPQFTNKLARINVVENSMFELNMGAEDSDGDVLTYMDPLLPVGISLDPVNRVLTIAPAAGQRGTFTLTFQVSDGQETVTESVDIIIMPAMTAVDLSSYLPPVGSQGATGSCASWATGYYYKSFQEGREHNWDFSGLEHRCCPSFLYNQLVQGNTYSGTTFEDNFNLLQTQGCATLNVMPYNNIDASAFPNSSQYEAAMPWRAQDYTWVGLDPDITFLRTHLAQGDIFVLGIPVYGDYLGPTGRNDVHDRPGSDSFVGYHAVAIVGYDDSRQYNNADGYLSYGAFKFVNSWGSTWSQDGYSWLSYNFVNNYHTFAYTMTDRVGYWVKGIAKFHITHPNRQDLVVGVGVGPTSAPSWNSIPFSQNAMITVQDIDASIDITDAVNYLPPSGGNKWFLGVQDASAGNLGNIDTFTIKYRNAQNGAFQEYNAADVPVNIPDAGPFVYSYVSGSANAIPSAPSNLIAAGASSSQINLTWTDNSSNETGFKIERSTNGTSYTQIAKVSANVTAYQLTGLTKGAVYYFRVRAYNSFGNSFYSNIAQSKTLSAPNAPTNLMITNNVAGRVTLGWNDSSDNESGFKVERSTNGATFSQLTTLAANSTSYVYTYTGQGSTNYFRVRAYNSLGNSAYSNTVKVTTVAVSAPPH